ncbi:MAG: 30S ribosomal protein S20 [Planctomycetota bacterium]|jgi:small subunit ribosomal protein S20|nr:MAG: 30S ribosomal protein S20 [Planctomycetota bacterium]
MPHSASAKKRHRQNLRDRDRNRAVKSEIKSRIRKVLEAISSGDVTGASEQLRGVAKTADRAAATGTIHRNKAARIKSRMSARLVAASKGGAAKPRKTAKSEG